MKSLGLDKTTRMAVGKRADSLEGDAARLETQVASEQAANAKKLADAQRVVDQFEAHRQRLGEESVVKTQTETGDAGHGSRRLAGEEDGCGIDPVARGIRRAGQPYFRHAVRDQHEDEGSEAAAEEAGGAIGKFGKTFGTVALWMTAYEAFFSMIRALEHGVKVMIDIEAHTAQLQSVMRGSKETRWH